MDNMIPKCSSKKLSAFLQLAIVLTLVLAAAGAPFDVARAAGLPPPPDRDEPDNRFPPPPENQPHGGLAMGDAANRVLDLSHSDDTTSVHVRDTYFSPYAGEHTFSLPALTSGLEVRADGRSLAYTILENPDNADTWARFSVPPSVQQLVLDYDQDDGTVPYDGIWYLSYNWVWGPTTIQIHLPMDASIIRYSDSDLVSVLNSHTLRVDVPSGTPVAITIVYKTSPTPDLYDTYLTSHFRLHLPYIYQQYANQLGRVMEGLYSRYSQYMGYDVNQLVHQSSFDFYFLPGGWNWWGTDITLSGGLCIVGGGPCAVNRWFVPSIMTKPDANEYGIVGYIGHELGHGWQGVVGSAEMPWWINDGEGYPSFLNQHGMSDLGYCPASSNGYQDVISFYQDYRSDPSQNRDFASIVIETGLRRQYGWTWLRKIHTDVLDHKLDLKGLSDQEKTNRMVEYLSNGVEENLAPYFDSSLISVSQTVRDRLSHLPASSAIVPEEWPCPAGRLIVEKTSLNLIIRPGASRIMDLGLHSEIGQTNWSISDPGVGWIRVGDSSGLSTPLYSDPSRLIIDTADLAEGSYHAQIVIRPDSPDQEILTVEINLLIRESTDRMLPLVTG